MPIYMDRHNISEGVTAENIAQLHNEDLKVQHKFGCKGLTYWFDEKRKTAFCLAEAPNKEAMIAMHNYAHGKVPHRIIEVDKTIVESFLGRIEDPEKSQNTELNIINDPAFRSIIAIKLKANSLNQLKLNELNIILEKFKNFLPKIISKNNGRLVNQDIDGFLISFASVSKAIYCAKNIQREYSKITEKYSIHDNEIHIGISTGVPVTNKKGFFEKAINSAKRMCELDFAQITVSSEFRDLYESEKLNELIDSQRIYILTPTNATFLKKLMDFTESNFDDETLTCDDFHIQLGYSKSQFYRKISGLLRKSPNIFLKEYRLNKSIPLINKKEDTISEIAFKIGFKSQSYFSKCFQKHYSISPSEYRSIINVSRPKLCN